MVMTERPSLRERAIAAHTAAEERRRDVGRERRLENLGKVDCHTERLLKSELDIEPDTFVDGYAVSDGLMFAARPKLPLPSQGTEKWQLCLIEPCEFKCGVPVETVLTGDAEDALGAIFEQRDEGVLARHTDGEGCARRSLAVVRR